MLSDMIASVKRAEEDARSIVENAKADERKLYAETEARAEEMIMLAREQSRQRTASALRVQQAAEDEKDSAADKETEYTLKLLRQAAKENSGVLREKLAELMFS